MKAAYTLLDRPEVTPQHLQAGRRSLVKARFQTPGTHLLLEDSAELGWTRVHPVADLASIGNLPSDQGRGHQNHPGEPRKRAPVLPGRHAGTSLQIGFAPEGRRGHFAAPLPWSILSP